MQSDIKEANRTRARYLAQRQLDQSELDASMARLAKTGADRIHYRNLSDQHREKAIRICAANGVLIPGISQKEVSRRLDKS